jgi:hypothetical protein
MKLQRSLAVAFYLLVSCFALASCFGSGPPDGYLATGSTSVSFMQFTEKNDQLTGHLQSVEETNDVPPRTQSSTTAFTGTQNGSSVTITLSIFGLSSSVTGTLNGNTLTLAIPQTDGHLKNETFTGASVQQYNQAVDALQKQVAQHDQVYDNQQATATAIQATQTTQQANEQATQTAQQSEQQAVSNANQQLSSDLNALKSDASSLASFSETSTLNGYANDWQAMQKDYAIEQQDAQAGCGANSSNYNQVQADANQVDADENQMLADDNQRSADKNQYDSDLSPVENDVQAVKNDWAQLQQAVANNPTGTPAPAYTASDINTALQNAQNAEQKAQGVWQSTVVTTDQYDQEASALQKKADALPASMNCS